MTYRTRQILRTTLPIAIWLLAAVGIYCFYRFSPNPRWEGALGLFLITPLYQRAVARHATCAKESFIAALVIGIASYWIPTVILLTPLIGWRIASYYTVQFKDVLAFLLGCATVAIYAVLFITLGWCRNRWACFFCPYLLWGWIPLLLVYFATKSAKIAHNWFKIR